jgi:hypothetical protein
MTYEPNLLRPRELLLVIKVTWYKLSDELMFIE